ncbi:MFS transporter [Streptomyces sp. I5]|nr:MFS transporter [Streptomyces sp. I5]
MPGRSAAGFTAQAAGATAGLLLDVLTFLVSTPCLLGIRTREEKPARQAGVSSSLVREMREGLRFLSGDPHLRPIVIYGASLNLLLMGYQAVQIVFLVRTVGVGAGAVGLLVMCSSLGGVLGALLATRLCRRWGNARALVLTQAFACPFALLLPLTPLVRACCSSPREPSCWAWGCPWRTSSSARSARATVRRACWGGSRRPRWPPTKARSRSAPPSAASSDRPSVRAPLCGP